MCWSNLNPESVLKMQRLLSGYVHVGGKLCLLCLFMKFRVGLRIRRFNLHLSKPVFCIVSEKNHCTGGSL